MSTGSEIIICGKRYDVGHKVVTFEDDNGYSAYVPHRTDNIGQIYASDPAPGLARRAMRYRQRRLMAGSSDLNRLRRVVRQITLHLDGCKDAAMCFDVLHNQRGLSVHFMVDNDGTIYQTLDVLQCAFHAAGVNEIAVGIELQNRGDAARFPNFYPGGRRTVTCEVHGVQFLAYDFTAEQYQAAALLCRALTRVFDVPLSTPHDGQGQIWTDIDRPRQYRGFLGHYHVSANKWDPGPFDFGRLFGDVGSRTTFPLTAPPRNGKRPARGQVELQASRYFESSEQDTSAHFPLGPLGRSRMWHGGVHLPAPEGTKVYAISRGRVVAARMGPPCPIGSCNFVLLRHRMVLRQHPVTFFSLYYHLTWATEVDPTPRNIPWLSHPSIDLWRVDLSRGDVGLLDVDVDGGEVLGHVGEAGPPGEREGQIHFAVLASSDIAAEVDPGYWEVIETSGHSRLCDDPTLLRKIDRPLGRQRPDGMLSRRELRNFFQLNPQREALHRLVVRHRSEWTPGGWDELMTAPDFADLPPARRRRLVDQQIRPTLWWTKEVAAHAGLPADGVVYAYHPIGFSLWLQRLTTVQRGPSRIGTADAWTGQMAPSDLTVDSESGAEMTDYEDYHSGEANRDLVLEDLVDGYPEE